mmetsp:Transcript_52654/g.93728  ORF Transcript_52654/g.93728 Transcript_52654/m.93728 type:complete len:101 (+) Transcript_52654:1361-1663(+)
MSAEANGFTESACRLEQSAAVSQLTGRHRGKSDLCSQAHVFPVSGSSGAGENVPCTVLADPLMMMTTTMMVFALNWHLDVPCLTLACLPAAQHDQRMRLH